MSILIRELNIKVSVGSSPETSAQRPSDSASSSDAREKALLQRVTDELLRIESLKKER